MLAAELGLLQPQEDRSMALVDIETGLGDHELAVRDAAHKFAAYFDGVSDWLADASRGRSPRPANP